MPDDQAAWDDFADKVERLRDAADDDEHDEDVSPIELADGSELLTEFGAIGIVLAGLLGIWWVIRRLARRG